MTATTAKVLAPGIYCPVITFFADTPAQELDIETHVKHVEMLARAGMHGVVVMGSTGEAVTLSRDERKELVRTAKDAFARVGSPGAIIAGTVGAQSTAQAIELSVDAAEAGADFTLVLPPAYYPGAMTPDALQSFFEDVASASPVPLIIYSYPAVSGGINMDTDLLGRLAKHPNIAGIKHTDHDVGKIARLANRTDFGSPFTVLGGATDYLLGTIAYGGSGAITGQANVCPRVCAKAFELAVAGDHTEALKYAAEISKAEWSLGKGGILGTKYAVTYANNYSEAACKGRKPLPAVPEASKAHVKAECATVIALERQLEKDGYVGLGFRKAKANGVNGSA